MNRHIILVGFMGTGKTTVGKLVAQRLSCPLVDTDHYLEQKRGKAIANIFSTEGERCFRQQEHDALAELVHSPQPQVITTGGGIVLRLDNVDLMKKNGWVVALTAARDVLIERLKKDTTRPLLTGDLDKRVDQLLTERKNAYDFAHVTIDTSHRSPVEVAKIVISKYKAVH